MKALIAFLTAVLLFGCAAQPVANSEAQASLPDVAVVTVDADVSLEYARDISVEPLNVSILLFDLSENSEDVSRVMEPIRNAEAAYLPVVLKNTLDATGFWGAVSVVPSKDTASEVFIHGVILESNALQLMAQIKVSDSRGVVWFDQIYRDISEAKSYDSEVTATEDPFQDLFDRVANDMAIYNAAIESSELAHILDTAMLRYAILLSPEAFSGYLEESPDGTVNLAGLPARNDPLYNRVGKLRSREYAVQDVIDDHFDNFFVDMGKVYPYWRQSSFELLAYNSQLALKDDARRRSSWGEVERIYRLYRERKLNEDELRELANSFQREIQPTIAELEGRVIELQGSLFDQYKSWRRLLREIYRESLGEAAVEG